MDEGVGTDQLLALVEKAVRGDRRLLTQLFRVMQQLAHHPSAPEEDRQLGDVLSLVLMGDRSPNLDRLPEDVAAEVQQMLERLKTQNESHPGEAQKEGQH